MFLLTRNGGSIVVLRNFIRPALEKAETEVLLLLLLWGFREVQDRVDSTERVVLFQPQGQKVPDGFSDK